MTSSLGFTQNPTAFDSNSINVASVVSEFPKELKKIANTTEKNINISFILFFIDFTFFFCLRKLCTAFCCGFLPN